MHAKQNGRCDGAPAVEETWKLVSSVSLESEACSDLHGARTAGPERLIDALGRLAERIGLTGAGC